MTTEYCTQMVYSGSLADPPEFCEAEALGDTELCPGHQEDDVWDRADEAYARMKEGDY
jgi:hypothetical protein